ncbi:hypothetical protein V1520DRAFT_394444 [Lipomyces starkeyi]|uniref:Cyclase n=1 Tax=Lipomyces starkeyi NRRL Y-11557 TaxID=675824 RepID=A0A1E3PTK3_LIPST|nr:hypothetical protein LIPSTDRAFT_243387 [Lipomyces starkeyi NRRL Y-11557]
MVSVNTPPKSFDDLPDYDRLPNKARYWVWGSPGSPEEGLGMLNLLSPQHVASCTAEIVTGDRVCLGWEFHELDNPPFGRIPFNMKINQIAHEAFDDEYHFNPQQSSQWDGFRHHSQPVSLSLKVEDAMPSPGGDDCVWLGGTTREEVKETDRIGIHHWAKKGIVGRGILVDYAAWANVRGIRYSCFSLHTIPLQHILEVMKYYNVESKPGDILFVRIGLIEEWTGMSAEQRAAYKRSSTPQHAGLEQSEEFLRWLWNSHFTAVASDAVSWEVFPPQKQSFRHHHYLLAGWGVPIGEMFNLDPLAELCHRLNRFSFFLASVPFNAVGGVSSAPNAVAIF